MHIVVRPKRKYSWIYTEAGGEQDYLSPERVRMAAAMVTSADTAAVTVPVIDSRPAAVSGSATESEADAETATVPRSGTEPVPAPHLSDTATRSTD